MQDMGGAGASRPLPRRPSLPELVSYAGARDGEPPGRFHVAAACTPAIIRASSAERVRIARQTWSIEKPAQFAISSPSQALHFARSAEVQPLPCGGWKPVSNLHIHRRYRA